MRTLGKRVGDEPRGFESRPLRSKPVNSLQWTVNREETVDWSLFTDYWLLTFSTFSNTLDAGRARWGASGALTPLTWLTRNPLQWG